ncbi:hypothetical protein ACOSQ4_030528 [Xanthoceras sorbifolium]
MKIFKVGTNRFYVARAFYWYQERSKRRSDVVENQSQRWRKNEENGEREREREREKMVAVVRKKTDVVRNNPSDIREVLQSYERKDIAKEFLKHSKDHQRQMLEQR